MSHTTASSLNPQTEKPREIGTTCRARRGWVRYRAKEEGVEAPTTTDGSGKTVEEARVLIWVIFERAILSE
ncbi:uncharacterized protein DS421_19g643740 [Arachis hypogaea]|uniref:Uncharacterized protein n=1 Tax=Arachis hypogaea TaxID=3818 RepID=A0A6B9V4Z0_ARAHY|nr:uncharacterized protein DS421_19g643740 [Arachis hypogaea]